MLGLSVSGCQRSGTAPADDRRATQPVDTALRHRLEAFSTAPRPQGEVAFCAVDLTADTLLAAYRKEKALPSASCMKLLSGMAGLHLLGTDYKYSTELYTTGQVAGDTLRGDLILRAGLDPQLTPEVLADLVRKIRPGFKAIQGKVVLVLSVDEPVRSEAHWYPWDLSFSHYGILFKGEAAIQRAMKQALQRSGISTKELQMVQGRLPAGARMRVRLRRPISAVIERMWKNSSNTQATALLYTIGRKNHPDTDPVTAGVRYMDYFRKKILGNTARDIVIHDGCGLCTHNSLSPELLTELLRYGYRRPELRRMLLRHLAVAGTSGTLRRMLPDAELRSKICGKTGTLSHPYGISSLAGLAKAANGHTIAFAIMCSEMSVLDAHVLQRKFCKILVSEHKISQANKP